MTGLTPAQKLAKDKAELQEKQLQLKAQREQFLKDVQNHKLEQDNLKAEQKKFKEEYRALQREQEEFIRKFLYHITQQCQKKESLVPLNHTRERSNGRSGKKDWISFFVANDTREEKKVPLFTYNPN